MDLPDLAFSMAITTALHGVLEESYDITTRYPVAIT